MRKASVGILAAAVCLVASGVLAQEGPEGMGGFYLGVGAAFVIDNFDIDATPEPEFDDTYGLVLLGGLKFDPYFTGEFEFDWLEDFEQDNGPVEVGVTTYMLNLKASPVSWETSVQPYALLGAGWMDAEAQAPGVDSKDSDFCGQAGLGLDLFPAGALSMGIRGSYVFGTGDVDEVQYTQISGLVMFNF
ncbi:MAG: porin family protein [Deltaproteobacteria bacterium]|nr:porin family protein [Deltaproteobacteria bacterium]